VSLGSLRKSFAFYDGNMLGWPIFGAHDNEECAVPWQHQTFSCLLIVGGVVLCPLRNNVQLDHATILHFKASLFVHQFPIHVFLAWFHRSQQLSKLANCSGGLQNVVAAPSS